jgi:hypothetical protein
VKPLDHYSKFRRALHTCKHCGWTGHGAALKNGKHTSLGIDKHCPKRGVLHSFAKFSVVVDDDTPDDWPPTDLRQS